MKRKHFLRIIAWLLFSIGAIAAICLTFIPTFFDLSSYRLYFTIGILGAFLITDLLIVFLCLTAPDDDDRKKEK